VVRAIFPDPANQLLIGWIGWILGMQCMHLRLTSSICLSFINYLNCLTEKRLNLQLLTHSKGSMCLCYQHFAAPATTAATTAGSAGATAGSAANVAVDNVSL